MVEGVGWILDVFFPKKCVHCSMPGRYICEKCLLSLPFLTHQYCPACRETSVLGFANHGCRKKTSLDQLYSVSWYRGPTVSMISAYKYERTLKSLYGDIKLLIHRSAFEDLVYMWDNAVFVPVPLSSHKLRFRGFNQSEAIARMLAELFGGTVSSLGLVRTRDTISQTTLSLRLRKSNVRDVFAVVSCEKIDSLRPYVLVDDVVTTGSTLEACALQLRKRYSLSALHAFTLARG